MKLVEPGPDIVAAATRGELAALDALLCSLQGGVFNLAVRMLGNRDDAADATQEILLKVTTHLAQFRGASAFTTWVYAIARRHLLDAVTRSAEAPTLSLEAIEDRLDAGLAFHAAGERPLTPEDKLAARQTALACTQGMLMTLTREQRIAWVLDTSFHLPGEQAAQVLEISPEAYRQRLSRAREKLDAFTRRVCGHVNPQASCRCERQLPALAHARAEATASGRPPPPKLIAIEPSEIDEAERHFAAFVRMSDAAALMRAHPEYRAPGRMLAAIRAVLRAEGFAAD